MGMTVEQYLALHKVLFEKWTELVSKEVDEDLIAYPTADVIDQLYIEAVWKKRARILLKIHDVVPKVTDRLAKIALINEEFANEPGLSSSELKLDVQDRLEWLKKRVAKEFEKDVKTAIDRHSITSPIEQIFLMEWKAHRLDEKLGVNLEPQKSITTDAGIYIVDFKLTQVSALNDRLHVAIELDGHQFHEKAPDQVRRDKTRERAIVRSGVTVLRFSGGEVVRNARACVLEVAEFLKQRNPRKAERDSGSAG
jgi:very-short-patch-repair endonuclease